MNSAVLIRHGETEWNRDGLYQGQLDSPLTATGIRQAQAMAARLAGKKFDALLSSDSGRTRHTAEIIAQSIGLDIRTDPRLRERHLGIFQGLVKNEIATRYPDEYEAYTRGASDYAIPGGESAHQVQDRMVACLREWRSAAETLVVVSHGGALNVLLRYILGLSLSGLRPFKLLNTAYNRIVFEDDRWQVETLGDISHLDGINALDEATA
jgi:2,3-bisphosphoglycerate-dependent phosphoglycerate mutase